MKTNRTLNVSYKVLYDNDTELLTDKLLEITKEHVKWMEETPWEDQAGDGRVVVPGVGIFEWAVDEEERERETTQDA